MLQFWLWYTARRKVVCAAVPGFLRRWRDYGVPRQSRVASQVGQFIM